MGLAYGTYQGRRVPLEKIMRGGRKKFKVYVISPATGKVKKVEFGDRDYKIKRDIEARRVSYRKRHHCDDASVDKPKDKAEFWSCKTWQKGISVEQLLKGPDKLMNPKVSNKIPGIEGWTPLRHSSNMRAPDETKYRFAANSAVVYELIPVGSYWNAIVHSGAKEKRIATQVTESKALKAIRDNWADWNKKYELFGSSVVYKKRNPGAVANPRGVVKSPSVMTAAQIEKELAANRKQQSVISDRFIARGLGHVPFSQLPKDDPDTIADIALMDRNRELQDEISKRLRLTGKRTVMRRDLWGKGKRNPGTVSKALNYVTKKIGFDRLGNPVQQLGDWVYMKGNKVLTSSLTYSVDPSRWLKFSSDEMQRIAATPMGLPYGVTLRNSGQWVPVSQLNRADVVRMKNPGFLPKSLFDRYIIRVVGEDYKVDRIQTLMGAEHQVKKVAKKFPCNPIEIISEKFNKVVKSFKPAGGSGVPRVDVDNSREYRADTKEDVKASAQYLLDVNGQEFATYDTRKEAEQVGKRETKDGGSWKVKEIMRNPRKFRAYTLFERGGAGYGRDTSVSTYTGTGTLDAAKKYFAKTSPSVFRRLGQAGHGGAYITESAHYLSEGQPEPGMIGPRAARLVNPQSDAEIKARAIGNSKTALLRELRSARSLLVDRLRPEFGVNDVFDFANKRLISQSGKVQLVWSLRRHPDKPESYENQQTSRGRVAVMIAGDGNREREVAQNPSFHSYMQDLGFTQTVSMKGDANLETYKLGKDVEVMVQLPKRGGKAKWGYTHGSYKRGGDGLVELKAFLENRFDRPAKSNPSIDETPNNLRLMLDTYGIRREADGFYPDFDSLRSFQVTGLLARQEFKKFKAPRNASGSRGRYLYNHIVKRIDAGENRDDSSVFPQSKRAQAKNPRQRGHKVYVTDKDIKLAKQMPGFLAEGQYEQLGGVWQTPVYFSTKRQADAMYERINSHIPPHILHKRGPRSRRNGSSSAESLYESFHGRPHSQVIDFKESIEIPDSLAELGSLVELWVIPVKSRSEKSVKITAPDPDKSRLADIVHLASSPDGRQLYFVGGDQELDTNALGFTNDERREHMVIGVLTELTYRTQKGFHKFKTVDYFHKLGEESGNEPLLMYDANNGHMSVAGGSYKVKDVGIVD